MGTINQLVIAGDSLSALTTNYLNFANGGYDAINSSFDFLGLDPFQWTERVIGRLGGTASLGPIIGSGFRSIISNVNNGSNSEWWWGGGGGGVSWGGASGSWTSVLSTDLWDKSPYGRTASDTVSTMRYASNGTNSYITWVKPPGMPTIVGWAFYYMDYTSGGNWSYQVDGDGTSTTGSWTNHGQTNSNNNTIKKFYVSGAINTRVVFRAANSAATSQGFCPMGIEVFYLDPTSGNTSGLIVHNLAVGGTQLYEFAKSTSGDRLAWFDSVVLGTGSPITNSPNLGTFIMHINDVSRGSTSQFTTDMTTFYNRVSPLGPVGFTAPWEGDTSTWSSVNQAAYRAILHSTATSLGAKWFDLYDSYAASGWTGNAAAGTAGLLYNYGATDNTHPSLAGNREIAARMFKFIVSALPGQYKNIRNVSPWVGGGGVRTPSGISAGTSW